jgi:hypothetical protein
MWESFVLCWYTTQMIYFKSWFYLLLGSFWVHKYLLLYFNLQYLLHLRVYIYIYIYIYTHLFFYFVSDLWLDRFCPIIILQLFLLLWFVLKYWFLFWYPSDFMDSDLAVVSRPHVHWVLKVCLKSRWWFMLCLVYMSISCLMLVMMFEEHLRTETIQFPKRPFK